MSMKDEMIYDFDLHMPRVLIGGKTAVLDNIKKVVMISDTNIVVFNGSRYTSVNGEELVVDQLDEERMLVTGNIKMVEFYEGK